MSSMSRPIPFVSFLLVVGAGCAPRQQPVAQAGLPVSLVAALIDDRGSPMRASPTFTDGRLPAGYPASLVPAGPVRIVGGMTTGDNVIAVFADSTRRLPPVFEQLFEQAGFTRPAPSE